MLKPKIEKAINKQINAELWSAYESIYTSCRFTHVQSGGKRITLFPYLLENL